MIFKETKYVSKEEILQFPDHYIAVPQLFKADDSAAVTSGTRKIIKAGTVYPSNDANTKGIVLYDVDVTDGDAMGALVRHGFLNTAKLPAVPSAAALAKLPMIEIFPQIVATAVALACASPAAIAVDEAADTEHDIIVTLSGAKFRDIASVLTNWTITGEDTTKVAVESITVSDDGTYVTIHTKNSATAVAGSNTITCAAAVIDIGVAPSAAVTFATVSAA